MDEVIEIFGKRLKVVTDNGISDISDGYCERCVIKAYCWNTGGVPYCEDAEGNMNRHFEEVID